MTQEEDLKTQEAVPSFTTENIWFSYCLTQTEDVVTTRESLDNGWENNILCKHHDINQLTVFCPIWSFQNLQIVRLTVLLLHVQVSKLKDNSVANGYVDPPFTPGVVGVSSWVVLGGQDTTLLTNDIMATAIICKRNMRICCNECSNQTQEEQDQTLSIFSTLSMENVQLLF